MGDRVSSERIDERESAVRVLAVLEEKLEREATFTRHESVGVPMSRMGNDPPLPLGVASRFPSFRCSHFPAYSAMIQFGCAFYASYDGSDSVGGRLPSRVASRLANPTKGGTKTRDGRWIGLTRGEKRGRAGEVIPCWKQIARHSAIAAATASAMLFFRFVFSWGRKTKSRGESTNRQVVLLIQFTVLLFRSLPHRRTNTVTWPDPPFPIRKSWRGIFVVSYTRMKFSLMVNFPLNIKEI